MTAPHVPSDIAAIEERYVLRMGTELQRERIVIPTAPHVPSDNAAIEAAEALKRDLAETAFDRAVAEFKARPTLRYHQEQVTRTAIALRDQAIADLERAAGRRPGAFREPQEGEEPAARVSEPAEGRGEFLGSFGFRTGRRGGRRCPKCGVADVACSHPECPPHLDPAGTDPYVRPLDPPAIVHGPDSPLLSFEGDLASRHDARLVPRRTTTVMHDSGPGRPVDPTIQAGDPA